MAFRPGARCRLLTACGAATLLSAACGAHDSTEPAQPDASAVWSGDATVPDSGAGDSGSSGDSGGDAATDATVRDTGALDTSLPREAAAEASTVDTGAADTGIVEASVADTGTTDAVVDSPAADGAGPVQGDVLTQHNDNARTGATLHESTLTVQGVRQGTFGMLFARALDDQTYAQPLVHLQVAIPGRGVHDVLYVATMSDTVYAFDADDPSQATPLWKTSLADATKGIAPVSHTDVGSSCAPFSNISGNIGIESTPVIDPSTGRIFVVAKTKDAGSVQSYTLHALDEGTGLDQVSPVVIQASAPGTGAGSVGGAIQFDASLENQRASLLLANGKVFVAFGGYCETGNYHGWLLAYDAATLAPTAAMVTTPGGIGSGIWMSGEGPAADAQGNVYVMASGGSMNAISGGADFGEALLRLTPSLTVTDWFAPFDYATLTSSGNFYGSAGVLLVPQTTLAVTGSETSKLYVNDTTALGHWQASIDSQIVQSFQLGGTELHGSPVCLGDMVYVWAAGDVLRRYQVSGGKLTLVESGPSSLSAGMPGGELSLSANGATPGTGILWVSQPLTGNAVQTTVPGILQAFDASNVTSELWDSHLVAGDDCGAFAKFASPTVANGRVYLPSFANQVCVYGKK